VQGVEWKQLLEELAEAVAVRNAQVTSLRNAGTRVTELAAQAIAVGAPGPSLTNILAALEPVVSQGRPHVRGQDPAVPLQRPECTAPPSAASAEAQGGPRIVRQLLNACAAHGDPEWLTWAQIADHLVGADLAT
jgi:hypothetical protein